MKKPFYKRWWFWAIVAFVVIGAVGSAMEKDDAPMQSTAPTQEATAMPEPIAEPTPEPTVEPTPEQTPTETPEPAREPAPEATDAPGDVMVWIPQSGSKYHSDPSCSNMRDPTQVTLEQAEAWDYGPCKKCYG